MRHLAFYVDRKIQTEIPAVKYRQDNITWNLNEARLLRKEAKTATGLNCGKSRKPLKSYLKMDGVMAMGLKVGIKRLC